MIDPGALVPVAPWPPAVAPALVVSAHRLLESCPVLVVTGPVRTELDRVAIAVAGLPEGPVWSRHVPRSGQADVPYFALRQIFPAVHPVAGDDLEALVPSIAATLDAVHDTRPIVLLSDADRCDRESIEILTALAVDDRLRLVLTLSSDALDERPGLRTGAEVLEVPSRSGEQVADLVRVRYGVPAGPDLVALVVSRSQGSHAAVCDLVDAAVTTGDIVVSSGVLDLAPRLRPAADPLAGPFIAATLISQDDRPDLTDLLHLTAVVGALEHPEAVACFSPSLIDELVTRGVLRVDGDVVRFTSAVESKTLRQSITLDRQADLFRRFAARIPRSVGRPGSAVLAADWWLACDAALPVDLAARAAREANLIGRYRRAIVFTDPARVEGGRPVALIERIFALVEVGDYPTLRTLYASLEPESLDEDELLPYFRWLDRLKDDEDRTHLRERAVTAADPAVGRRRVAVRTLSDLIERAFGEAGEAITSELRSLTFTSLLSPSNRAMAFTTLAAVLRHSGRPSQAVEASEFALELLAAQGTDVSAFHLETAREYHVLALLSALELDRAEAAIDEYAIGPLGRPGSGRLTTGMRAMIHLYRGDSARALDDMRLCLAGIRQHDPRNVRGWLEAMLALVLLRSGRLDEAADMLEASRSHRTQRVPWDLEKRLIQAAMTDALAEPEDALDMVDAIVTEARERGLHFVEINAAALGLTIGGPPHLRTLLEAVDHLVDPVGIPAVWQTFARAARDYDIAAMVDLGIALERAGNRLYSAGIAQYVLDIARRADDLDEPTRQRMERLTDLWSSSSAP